MKQVIFSAMLSVAILLTPSAAVAEEVGVGPYIGAGIAHVTFQDYCGGSAASCDDSATGFEIFGGVRPHENFGLEAGYTRAAGFDVSGQIQGQNVSLDAVFGSLYLAGTAAFPIGEVVSLTGKAGFHAWDFEVDVASGGQSATLGSADGTDPMFGVGVGFRPNDKVFLQAEWTRMIADERDFDAISGSLAWTF